jgi:phosphohistidine swiveling domain-containing protein
MADDKLAELLKTQKSLTEWLEDIGHKDTALLRAEDNDKRERLKVLNELIGLPFDRPTQFEATDLSQRSEKLQAYLAESGDSLCALRLIPKINGLPKLRMRGKSVREALAWFDEQELEPSNYRADFIPHSAHNSWATIFIVNRHGIQGEIIFGGHHQLTQGFHEAAPPTVFHYDFRRWQLTPTNSDALAYLKKITKMLRVANAEKRQQLTEQLGTTFSHDYLEGYFETTDSELGTWFIDYSPRLGKMYADASFGTAAPSKKAVISGQTGCRGTARGPVKIVDPDHIEADFPEGTVLVCKVTTPLYVPLMKKACAIVTDQGGILSHAAIIARELNKPCLVSTGNATSVLTDGQLVTVDANNGVVKL